jgi:DNA-binding XRE family transcriptional regulator
MALKKKNVTQKTLFEIDDKNKLLDKSVVSKTTETVTKNYKGFNRTLLTSKRLEDTPGVSRFIEGTNELIDGKTLSELINKNREKKEQGQDVETIPISKRKKRAQQSFVIHDESEPEEEVIEDDGSPSFVVRDSKAEYKKMVTVETSVSGNDEELNEETVKIIAEAVNNEVNKLMNEKLSQIQDIIRQSVKTVLDDEEKERGYSLREEQHGTEVRSNYSFGLPDMFGEYHYDFSKYELVCKVKEVLTREGKTQKWLSMKSKIPQSTLSQILNNETSVSLEYAMRISLVMNKPITELFEYSQWNTEGIE